MDIFQDLLKSYQKHVSTGNLYAKKQQFPHALSYFKNAAIDMFSAIEYSETNADLKKLAESSSDFKGWLVQKQVNMRRTLMQLEEHTKTIETQLYASMAKEDNANNKSSDRSSGDRSSGDRSSGDRSSGDRDQKRRNKRDSRRRRSDDTKDSRKRRRRSDDTKDSGGQEDWADIAEQSLNLLHRLRSKQVFDDKYEQDFEQLIFKRRQQKNKRGR